MNGYVIVYNHNADDKREWEIVGPYDTKEFAGRVARAEYAESKREWVVFPLMAPIDDWRDEISLDSEAVNSILDSFTPGQMRAALAYLSGANEELFKRAAKYVVRGVDD